MVSRSPRTGPAAPRARPPCGRGARRSRWSGGLSARSAGRCRRLSRAVTDMRPVCRRGGVESQKPQYSPGFERGQCTAGTGASGSAARAARPGSAPSSAASSLGPGPPPRPARCIASSAISACWRTAASTALRSRLAARQRPSRRRRAGCACSAAGPLGLLPGGDATAGLEPPSPRSPPGGLVQPSAACRSLAAARRQLGLGAGVRPRRCDAARQGLGRGPLGRLPRLGLLLRGRLGDGPGLVGRAPRAAACCSARWWAGSGRSRLARRPRPARGPHLGRLPGGLGGLGADGGGPRGALGRARGRRARRRRASAWPRAWRSASSRAAAARPRPSSAAMPRLVCLPGALGLVTGSSSAAILRLVGGLERHGHLPAVRLGAPPRRRRPRRGGGGRHGCGLLGDRSRAASAASATAACVTGRLLGRRCRACVPRRPDGRARWRPRPRRCAPGGPPRRPASAAGAGRCLLGGGLLGGDPGLLGQPHEVLVGLRRRGELLASSAARASAASRSACA